MRLIKPPTKTFETFNAQKSPTLCDMLAAKWKGVPVKNTQPIISFSGKMKISNCIIEFDTFVMLGDKIETIIQGNYILEGVMPISQLGPTTYECTVDHFENTLEKRHEERY